MRFCLVRSPTFPTGKRNMQKLCQRLQFSGLSLCVPWVHGRYSLVKSRVYSIVWTRNPTRSRFAKPCKDAKIFVMLAKFFSFTKNFGFAKVSTYSEEIGFSGDPIEQRICEFGGFYRTDKYGKTEGEFLGKGIDFFRCFPQPMPDTYPRSGQIFGDVWQCRVWSGAEFQPHIA